MLLRHLLLTCSLASLLVAGTCDFTSGGPVGPVVGPSTLNGLWTGEATSDFGDVRRVTLDLREFEVNVHGTARMTGPDGKAWFTGLADGTHFERSVSLVLTADGYEPITATGRQEDGTTLTLSLSGAGWDQTPVTLHRKTP